MMFVPRFVPVLALLLSGTAYGEVLPQDELVDDGGMKVCDVYGKGFFYLAGTETCLRIGGYVQYDLGAGQLFGRRAETESGIHDSYFDRTRVSLQLDTKTATELGTLRSFADIFFNYGSLSGKISAPEDSVEIKHAYIELGGLRLGKSDSLFKTFTRNGGAVVNDQLVPYAPVGTSQIVYTRRGENGISFAVGAEQGKSPYLIDSYLPHLVGGVSLSREGSGVTFVTGFDSRNREWSGKIRADWTLKENMSVWLMAGYDTTRHSAKSYYKPWEGNWALWGGGKWDITSRTGLALAAGLDEGSNMSLAVALPIEPVSNLLVQPELGYRVRLNDDVAGKFGGWLRIRRSY